MNIAYIAHLNPFQASGGGEMILRLVLSAGRDRGHHIELFDATTPAHQIRCCRADLYFLADVYNCPWSRRQVPQDAIAQIVANERYIHFDNAYVDVCDVDYLPCNGEVCGEICPHKRWRHRCFRERTRAMYRNSRLNIFLSPLHRRTIQKLLGEESVGRYMDYYSPIDGNRFFVDPSVKRDIPHLFVGVVCEAKGLDEMRRRFGGDHLVLAGAKAHGAKLDFGAHLGKVPYEEVPGLMRRAESLVMLPRWPEPFGRVAVEAAMCGCKLIANDRVGALSFEGESPTNGTEELWRQIEGL